MQRDRLDPLVWKITSVAVLGSLLAQLDATIVNVSLAGLAQDLHTTLPAIQWVTSGYLLALTLVLPLNGWLIDRIGGKALYLWCFSTFTVSSLFCGLAWSADSLIGFRLIQGASGGLLAPMAQLMMKRAAGSQFTRVAGYATVPILLGPLLGPVIAGTILQYASWRWLFFVNLPVGVLALFLSWLFLPEDRDVRRPRDLDWIGLVLLSPGLALILLGMERIRQHAGIVATLAGVLLLVVFVRIEARKAGRALIDLRLFRQRTFSAAASAQFLSNGVMFAGQMLIPLFLIQACGRSASEMGWMLAPLGLGMMVVFPTLGFLTDRLGGRFVATAGALLSLAGTLMLAWLATHPLEMAVLVPTLFVRGAGLGATALPAMSAAYATVEPRNLPMANTTLNIVQRLGGPTVTTLCALVLAALLGTHATMVGLNAWEATFLLLATLHAAMAVTVAWLPGRTSVRE